MIPIISIFSDSLGTRKCQIRFIVVAEQDIVVADRNNLARVSNRNIPSCHFFGILLPIGMIQNSK